LLNLELVPAENVLIADMNAYLDIALGLFYVRDK